MWLRFRGLDSSSSMGMAWGRGTIAPRLTAECHDSLANPKRRSHSRLLCPAS